MGKSSLVNILSQIGETSALTLLGGEIIAFIVSVGFLIVSCF